MKIRQKSLLSLKKMRNLKILKRMVIFGLCIVHTCAFGYDFSDARNSLVRDLMTSSYANSDGRLAIVYQVVNRNAIQERYNLVKLKKNLAYELVKSFQVTDPVIVQEIMEKNRISYDQIMDDRSILRQFSNRADCSQVLFVELNWMDSRLMTSMKLVASDGRQISQVNMEVAPESDGQAVSSMPINTRDTQSDRGFFSAFNMDFAARYFQSDQNDSWIYFSPTALLVPETHSIELLLWLKHLGEVDIRPVRFRYDIRLFKVIQAGIQSFAITENRDDERNNSARDQGHHSTYFSLKYQIIDDSRLPTAIMVGIRRRVSWDSENLDFRTRDEYDRNIEPQKYQNAKDRDEKNDQYNQLTLTAAVTGKFDLGLMYNFYLDSQAFSAGLKFLVTSNIKLLADSILYYYDDPLVQSDHAFGIQLCGEIGTTMLSYQYQTDQAQLGLSFDF